MSIWMDFLRVKHPETHRHSVRLAILAEELASVLKLSSKEKNNLVRGCFLHDIGKSFIPVQILDQQEPLSTEQWELLKLHPILGADLAGGFPGIDTGVTDVIRYHHERWDGEGYPYNLKGANIPFLARICAVIDAFDSMISYRTYRERSTIDWAKNELSKCAGTQFDRDIVHYFLSMTTQQLSV